VHTQVWSWQTLPPVHLPQDPSQPSSPHCRPSQLDTQPVTQVPVAEEQVVPSLQSPHEPPQPLSPQLRPRQSATQERQAPSAHPSAHSVRRSVIRLQPSTHQTSPSWHRVEARGAQPHCPPVQPCPSAHSPQEPPQPSSPQTASPQLGVQAPATHQDPTAPRSSQRAGGVHGALAVHGTEHTLPPCRGRQAPDAHWESPVQEAPNASDPGAGKLPAGVLPPPCAQPSATDAVTNETKRSRAARCNATSCQGPWASRWKLADCRWILKAA